MIYKRIEVDQDDYKVSFRPPTDANFKPVEATYPTIANEETSQEFKDALEEEIHIACGQTACCASVKLTVSEHMLDERLRSHFQNDASWLHGATLQCDTDECPLR